MMVETILESSQDFGTGAVMTNGSLPQWKRELLQRRAARSRTPANFTAPPQQPPSPPPLPQSRVPLNDDNEELRYGPGIVERLKSRYLSLALRETPRRRPSVLRRATSLEHLLDERPPPAPRPRQQRVPRPVSLAAPVIPRPDTHVRRDVVKRARSVDALSRLEAREEPHSPPPPTPSLMTLATSIPAPPPPPIPPPPPARLPPYSSRPPRRPTPLLRDAERPPPDLVRSTLRKFESTPTRRPAPSARVSAFVRTSETVRTSTPEPHHHSPTPPLTSDISAINENVLQSSPVTKLVSRTALDNIANAGSSVRYLFESPRCASHLPPPSATNPVLNPGVVRTTPPRRVCIIRPMPAPTLDRTPSVTPPLRDTEKQADSSVTSLQEVDLNEPSQDRKDPPLATLEPASRPSPQPQNIERLESKVPESNESEKNQTEVIINGHEQIGRVELKSTTIEMNLERKLNGTFEGTKVRKTENVVIGSVPTVVTPWARTNPARSQRPPASGTTSIVFNFSNRKEVPDYIENDGQILRASRKNLIKPGESGVVLLRPDALRDSESDSEEVDAGPPSPCTVRFINDNVLMNGRSSMPPTRNRDRISKLKLQFDDSMTRTFEYPSETSFSVDTTEGGATCVDVEHTPLPRPRSPPLHTHPLHPTTRSPAPSLLTNTHIASEPLSRYTPSKTLASSFQLGVTRLEPPPPASNKDTEVAQNGLNNGEGEEGATETEREMCEGEGARSWSEARAARTDLLF